MAGAPLARSDITLSSWAMNRKRLWQRFGRISVSDESHCGLGPSGALRVPSKQALCHGERCSRGRCSRRPHTARKQALTQRRRSFGDRLRARAHARSHPLTGPSSGPLNRARNGSARARDNGAAMSRYRPAKGRCGARTEPYAMTRKASGTDRNLTHSCSPMYSPSTWNASGRLDLKVSSA